MKIKRFFAPDIRKAMAMVKEELGSEAVIMSNRTVDGGVEIVAARDFDEHAIHSGLNNEKPENASARKGKKVELNEFKSENKPLHVIQSARKKGAPGTVPQRRVQKGVDQYVGYAEKIHLNSGWQQSRKIAEKLQGNSHLDQLMDAPVRQKKEEPVKQPEPSVQIEALMKQVRQEMRQEIQSLSSLMDTRLSEMNWHQDKQRHPVRLDLLRKMAEMGFSKTLAIKIANRLGTHKDAELAFDKSLEMLARILPVAEDNLLEYGGIAALVGPTGVGKTTTVAKLAAQFILKHGSRQVALITTDNYRIGAHEQLNTYGRILDIPVRVANNAEELHQHINSFMDKRLILIDTAGMSQRDMRLAEQIQTLQQDDIPIKTYLVMSAATQYKTAKEIIEAFKIFSPQASILTKLDETVTQGAILSSIIEQQLPLAFVTDGQQVPEDINEPEPEKLIQCCANELEQEEMDEVDYEEWVAEGHA